MSDRSMTDRQRAFLALQGKRFPRVGEIGTFTGRRGADRFRALVVVRRVSRTGTCIWTHFKTNKSQLRFGSELHRWERYIEGYSTYIDGITGELTFKWGRV